MSPLDGVMRVLPSVLGSAQCFLLFLRLLLLGFQSVGSVTFRQFTLLLMLYYIQLNWTESASDTESQSQNSDKQNVTVQGTGNVMVIANTTEVSQISIPNLIQKTNKYICIKL